METRTLKDDEVLQLRLVLEGTSLNVFNQCRRSFQAEVGDEVFDQLEKVGLFKCETCNVWRSTSLDRSDIADDLCKACAEDDDR